MLAQQESGAVLSKNSIFRWVIYLRGVIIDSYIDKYLLTTGMLHEGWFSCWSYKSLRRREKFLKFSIISVK